MPEGDTVHATAKALRELLQGARLTRLEIDHRDVAVRPGDAVVAVEAIGKHLLVRLAAGGGSAARVLRVHLGMKGSWHRYRPGEPWQRPRATARVVIVTAAAVAVCFRPRQVELLSDERALRRGPIGRLGPDLLGDAFDVSEVLRRARAPTRVATAVADVLLDQTVACGIGNVYKSEVLFLERVHPWRPVGELGDDALAAVYSRARALMRDNVDRGGWRVTASERRPAAGALPRGLRHWVYRRAGRPCPRCQTLIRSRAQGPAARVTYWCPRCQPAGAR